MLWLRYLGISFLKWVVTYAATALLIVYVLPKNLSGYGLAAFAWLVAFGISFACAEWAFSIQIPGKRETAMLVAIWMVVTLSLFILYFWYFFGTVSPFIYSVDTYIQLLLELLAILLAAYLTRRRKIKAAFGEGLAE
jgi:hypothetical protein